MNPRFICPDACGRSIGVINRQAGLLALGSWQTSNCLPKRGRNPHSVATRFEDLADYSGGPATDLHRFPVSPPAQRPAAPGELLFYLQDDHCSVNLLDLRSFTLESNSCRAREGAEQGTAATTAARRKARWPSRYR